MTTDAPESQLEKVTAFITRDTGHRRELLVFEHPVGVIQIPAGTVESGESAEEAARREAHEETGLASLTFHSYLGQQPQPMWPDHRVVLRRVPVRQQPDSDAPEAVPSFAYHGLRRGLYVRQTGAPEGRYIPVAYEEFDGPAHLATAPSRSLQGWVEADALSSAIVRHFFHFTTSNDAPEAWVQHAEEWGLPFALFWLPLAGERSAVTQLVPSQAAWVADFRVRLLVEIQGNDRR